MSEREQQSGLNDRDKAQLKVMGSMLESLRDAFVSGDSDGASVVVRQLVQVDIDWGRVRDCLHVPEDAGECAEGLQQILLRIPDGWGRYVRASKGWYPILVRLDEALTALDPDYRVYQVKEKLGCLRYYFGTDRDEVQGAMNDLVAAAEAAAERTCEECGDTGTGVRLRSDHYRYQTLCEQCADRRSDRTLRPI
ncbi:hypothetical protein [Rhodococcus sp. BL-253-APC-6A1W]|uniref:hypothetical protein n=1 Tax=Rhodococcus sp. BL-253-APC-6A1W TaxID=2725307 RepID=UPI001980DDC2|nr:hypothetical protein [Rhodococcus sp. BL-253-APC-6A1W]